MIRENARSQRRRGDAVGKARLPEKGAGSRERGMVTCDARRWENVETDSFGNPDLSVTPAEILECEHVRLLLDQPGLLRIRNLKPRKYDVIVLRRRNFALATLTRFAKAWSITLVYVTYEPIVLVARKPESLFVGTILCHAVCAFLRNANLISRQRGRWLACDDAACYCVTWRYCKISAFPGSTPPLSFSLYILIF